MGNNAVASKPTQVLDSGKFRVKSIDSNVLPADICSIVAEYLSDGSSDYVEAALVGFQPITLCLSQFSYQPMFKEVKSMGFVSSEHRWVPNELKIDKQFSIKDHKLCLHFLEQKNSNYCPVAIEVLILDVYADNFLWLQVLDDLQETITALQKHLKSVKHVVLSINDCTCFIFSLKKVIDTVTGVFQSVDSSKALFEILDDLRTCWKENDLIDDSVFSFYFKSSVPPVSEKYISKYVIDSAASFAGELLKEEALRIPSSKIMWVLDVNRCSGYKVLPDYTRLCHAVYFDGSSDPKGAEHICRFSHDMFCYRDNPYVERIVMNCMNYGQAIQLPCPSTPLIDNSPRSALIELTLKGGKNAIHLTHLNSGYFPHLRHLCIIGGLVTGHLDSHRVPLLKTLRIEPDRLDTPDRVQPLLRCGRPWQIVATQTNGGWSFASYEEPIANPQDEVKEGSTFSGSSLNALPLIRELVLVGNMQEHINEWQSQLKGMLSLETTTDDHNDRILMWEPQCVEKIAVFNSILLRAPRLEFTGAKLEQERILFSLECYHINVEVDGDALPNLQSLELNSGWVKLSGAFPRLQTLSLYDTTLGSQWEVDAPLLQSLNCDSLHLARELSICPKRLPLLSFFKIMLLEFDAGSPRILDGKGGLGFSRVNRVVVGKGITEACSLDRWQLQNVSHLELTLGVLNLPACWLKEVWQCETLTIHLNSPMAKYMQPQGKPMDVVLPFLPQVKKLTVTAKDGCGVLLDKEMPHLTVCSLPSLKSLGQSLLCPLLKRIRFTDKLSERDKKRALSRATYVAMKARPSEIIFAADYEFHTMAWDVVP